MLSNHSGECFLYKLIFNLVNLNILFWINCTHFFFFVFQNVFSKRTNGKI